jgi:hypothetical protein
VSALEFRRNKTITVRYRQHLFTLASKLLSAVARGLNFGNFSDAIKNSQMLAEYHTPFQWQRFYATR